MADEKKYSIISVSSDDEDDGEVVIQAGIPQESVESTEPEEEATGGQARLERPQQTQGEANLEDVPDAGGDIYEETTMEDLDTVGPLPKTRIVILVCAILLIAVFLFYYNFMR